VDIWQSLVRTLLRVYLSRFPLRNGKGRLYDALQEKLLPAERFVTVRLRFGFHLKLDLSEPAQRKIYYFGDYDERHEISLLRRVLLPDDIFWDIGANIGYYTLTASPLVGPGGLVVAFEPAAHAWKSLLMNLSLNASGNVRPVQIALSDAAGQAVLYRQADFADGGASLIRRPDYHANTEEVTTTTLDFFLAQSGSPPPTFIKIDVEGFESNVLTGARRILHSEQPPLLLIEMNDPEKISAMLAAARYQGAYLYRRRWYPAQSPAQAKSRNMLWYQPDSPLHRQRLALINFCSCRSGNCQSRACQPK
jgi:FkbM family methyltransferase